MNKIILVFILMTCSLVAGGVFKGEGDVKWWKGALGVKEVIGYKILESEVSSVHGRKYWAYKIQVIDVPKILKNMNIDGIRKITNETDQSSARKLLPLTLEGAQEIYYSKKRFYDYYDDLFIIYAPEEGEDVMFVVFSAESFSPKE